MSILRRLAQWASGARGHDNPLLMRGRRELRRFEIGEWSYGTPTIVDWSDGATLRIGRFCSIAGGVTILLGGEHHGSWVSTYPFAEMFPGAGGMPRQSRTLGDVIIGSDVWIGREALIRSGCRIGNGAIVGARSVVTREVPDYAVVAGSPARLVRLRFSEAQIQSLLRIAWWNWSIEAIQSALPLLNSANIDEFIRAHSPRPEGKQ